MRPFAPILICALAFLWHSGLSTPAFAQNGPADAARADRWTTIKLKFPPQSFITHVASSADSDFPATFTFECSFGSPIVTLDMPDWPDKVDNTTLGLVINNGINSFFEKGAVNVGPTKGVEISLFWGKYFKGGPDSRNVKFLKDGTEFNIWIARSPQSGITAFLNSSSPGTLAFVDKVNGKTLRFTARGSSKAVTEFLEACP